MILGRRPGVAWVMAQHVKCEIGSDRHRHFDPTTPGPFCDLASPGHCQWQCALEKYRGNNGCWNLHCEVAAPKRYNDMADIVLMHNSPHAQVYTATSLYHQTPLG